MLGSDFATKRRAVLSQFKRTLRCMALVAGCSAASAQVSVNNTRLVFPAGPKHVEFALTNESKQSQTIRAWVDYGDAQVEPDDIQAPFFVVPPVSKIEPGRKQTLRISYTGENLPAGQESLFYLNILNLAPASEIKDGQNSMRLNARSRFKIFFRPAALSGNPLDAAQQLVWRLNPADPAARLTANNPSPYFLSLVRVRLMRGQQVLQELESGMAAPFGSASFPLQAQGSDPRGATSVQYQYIDDYGLHRDCEFVLNTPG